MPESVPQNIEHDATRRNADLETLLSEILEENEYATMQKIILLFERFNRFGLTANGVKDLILITLKQKPTDTPPAKTDEANFQ